MARRGRSSCTRAASAHNTRHQLLSVSCQRTKLLGRTFALLSHRPRPKLREIVAGRSQLRGPWSPLGGEPLWVCQLLERRQVLLESIVLRYHIEVPDASECVLVLCFVRRSIVRVEGRQCVSAHQGLERPMISRTVTCLPTGQCGEPLNGHCEPGPTGGPTAETALLLSARLSASLASA